MWSALFVTLGVLNAIFGVLLGSMSILARKALKTQDKVELGLIKLFWAFSALFVVNAVVFFVINGAGLCG